MHLSNLYFQNCEVINPQKINDYLFIIFIEKEGSHYEHTSLRIGDLWIEKSQAFIDLVRLGNLDIVRSILEGDIKGCVTYFSNIFH